MPLDPAETRDDAPVADAATAVDPPRSARVSREVLREQTVVDELYGRLDDLRDDTERRLDEVRRSVVGGNHQARSERDAFARMHSDRLEQLREVDERLVFGRITVRGSEEDRYIGRIGLRDDDQHSLLVDWRAPIASPFYQATAAQPQGVRARRHITLRGREVAAIDDEVFDEDLLEDAGAGRLVVEGEGALIAAVSAQRTGRMGDIVATIQGEQDRIIRSESRGALVVQGGPGTGKTAVALHRAAYLLYAQRERLGRAGVLVVGPSPAFVRYIDQVLPSLGETGVVLQSLGRLVPGVVAEAVDAARAQAIKGSLPMADLLERAVRSRQRVPDTTQTLDIDGDRVVLRRGLVAAAVRRAQQTGRPHNEARVVFVKSALDQLARQHADDLRAAGRALDDSDLAVLREDIRTAHDVRVALNTAWLPLTPEKLLQDLYSRPAWLAELTPDWSDADREALHRDRDAPFTVDDVPLLDEAAELLGEPPAGEDAATRQQRAERDRNLKQARDAIADLGVEGIVDAESLVDSPASAGASTAAELAADDRTWVYGHVVVDEAQELSPMQWRLLVRRCPMRSFTIVGDTAQAESASAAGSWTEALAPFFRDSWRVEELTVNYRTPAQIAERAEEIAVANGVAITPTVAVREGEHPVRTVSVPGGGRGAVLEAVVEAVRADRERPDAGTTAVVVAASRVDDVARTLRSEFGGDARRGLRGLDVAIAVLVPAEAKGLEFDGVVVVDPDGIVAGEPRGAAGLYVAMTRPTQRLTMVEVERA